MFKFWPIKKLSDFHKSFYAPYPEAVLKECFICFDFLFIQSEVGLKRYKAFQKVGDGLLNKFTNIRKRKAQF